MVSGQRERERNAQRQTETVEQRQIVKKPGYPGIPHVLVAYRDNTNVPK